MSYPVHYSRELISSDGVGGRQCLWKVALIKNGGDVTGKEEMERERTFRTFNKTLSVKHISGRVFRASRHIHAVACQEGCQGSFIGVRSASRAKCSPKSQGGQDGGAGHIN